MLPDVAGFGGVEDVFLIEDAPDAFWACFDLDWAVRQEVLGELFEPGG